MKKGRNRFLKNFEFRILFNFSTVEGRSGAGSATHFTDQNLIYNTSGSSFETAGNAAIFLEEDLNQTTAV